MGLDSVVRNAVKTVDSVVKSLEETVLQYPWVGQDGFGAPAYDTVVPLKAIVEQKLQMKWMNGKLVKVKAKLTFLQVIAPNGATGRDEPIDTRDKLVLADGTTGPILKNEGLRDPGKARPFLSEVWLGV